MKICVFCSANQQIDPEFFTMTEELGTWAAKNGHSIVYGGVNQGLMECLGKAVKAHQGQTIGVVPMIVERSGRLSDYVDIEIPCDNLTRPMSLSPCLVASAHLMKCSPLRLQPPSVITIN